MKRLYLVKRRDNIGFDEYDSWVVRAKSPKEALSLVEWADGNPKRENIEVSIIRKEGKSKTILGSYNAG